ncbi:hypothetical protein HK101_011781 [Irineochytrium annulatum]|nr:hypothetical protein HK101_011781 [Irineochytrium annulatum]
MTEVRSLIDEALAIDPSLGADLIIGGDVEVTVSADADPADVGAVSTTVDISNPVIVEAASAAVVDARPASVLPMDPEVLKRVPLPPPPSESLTVLHPQIDDGPDGIAAMSAEFRYSRGKEIYGDEMYTDPLLATDSLDASLFVPWDRIFWFLGDFPESLETLRDVCVHFRIVCSEPEIRAAYFLKMSNKYLVFNDVYMSRPWALTFDLADALLGQGALLPKYFVEKAYRAEQQAMIDAEAGWEQVKPPLPQGTLEYLVAHAYKLYSEVLLLNLADGPPALRPQFLSRLALGPNQDLVRPSIDGVGPPKIRDDAWLFERSLPSSGVPNIKVLKKICEEHHYTPALNPPSTIAEWDELWGRVLNLIRVDADLGKFLVQHCGMPAQNANDFLVAKALKDPKSKDTFIKWLKSQGFSISKGAAVLVLADTNLQLDSIGGLSALDLMRSVLTEEELNLYAEAALAVLFRDGKRDSLRAVDALLLEFSDLSEEAIARAFLADPNEVIPPRPDGSPTLPFITQLGRAQGGMTDMLWQLVLARYGARHAFAGACLIDLVIGGTLKNPLKKEKEATSPVIEAFGVMPKLPSPPIIDAAVARGSTDEEDDRDRDSATRDSISAMIDGADVVIEPNFFGPVSRSVLLTKSARPRVLDFLARLRVLVFIRTNRNRVEKALIRATFNPESSPLDRQRWSKVRWVAALRRNVIDDRLWLAQIVSPVELQAIDERKRRERGPPKRSSGIFTTPASTDDDDSLFTPNSFASAASASLRSLGGMVRSRARNQSGGLASFLTSVVDLVDKEWADVRRFYGCCETLVKILETPRPGAHLPASASPVEHPPFARWLQERDLRTQVPSIFGWMKNGVSSQAPMQRWF